MRHASHDMVPIVTGRFTYSYCQLAGIGSEENGQFWPCVGKEECLNGIGDRREGIFMAMPF